MTKTNQEVAEEKHPEIMGLLTGEMGLVRPNINRVTNERLVVTTARHRADTLTDLVSDPELGYVVATEEKIPKQPRDMTRYSSLEIVKID